MKILLTILTLILPITLQAQPDSLWSKTFGGMRTDYLHGLISTSDGGYALCGSFGYYEEREERGIRDLYLVKTDENGDEVWSATYGGNSRDQAWDLVETADGGFLVVGETSSYEDSSGAWVVKVDSTGEMEWWQTYGDGVDRFVKIIHYGERYLVSGRTNYAGAGSSDIWLVLIEDDGEEVDSWTFGDRGRDWAVSMTNTFDDGVIICGTTSAPDGVDADGILIKMDSDFETEWINIYDAGSQEGFGDVCQLSDSSFFAVGTSGELGPGEDYNLYFVRVDINGDSLWTKTVGGNEDEEFGHLATTPDGDLIVACQISNDVYLLRLDENANVIWSSIYEDGSMYGITEIVATDDGGYAFATTTHFSAEGQWSDNLWLVKLNTDMLRLLDVPDTAMVSTDTLIYDLSYFDQFVSPPVYLDSALTYELQYDGEMDVGIVFEQLYIIPGGWVGVDSLSLITLEEDNEENGDTTRFYITVEEPDAVEDMPDIPVDYALLTAYPNPFNSTVNITYTMENAGPLTVAIYDIEGREVERLHEGVRGVGTQSFTWNAESQSSGIYFARIETNSSTEMIKMSLVR